LWLQQADQLQAADGIPHGTPTHAKLLRQLAFGGKHVTRLKVFEDVVLDLSSDLFINLIATDRLERDSSVSHDARLV
jgi:hypothetical protein